MNNFWTIDSKQFLKRISSKIPLTNFSGKNFERNLCPTFRSNPLGLPLANKKAILKLTFITSVSQHFFSENQIDPWPQDSTGSEGMILFHAWLPYARNKTALLNRPPSWIDRSLTPKLRVIARKSTFFLLRKCLYVYKKWLDLQAILRIVKKRSFIHFNRQSSLSFGG